MSITRGLLDHLELDAPFHGRVHSLRRLVEAFTFEIDLWTKSIAADLYERVRAIVKTCG